MKIYKIPEPALLHLYQNGNYDVKIYSDGTKVRTTEDDEFIAQFPENIDCKITNKCDMGCAFCHENSVVDGLHGNINHPILSTLHPGQEIAIGGGNIFEHPDFEEFLIRLKDLGVISNITVNRHHIEIEENLNKVRQWQKEKLVYGVGISYNGSVDYLKKVIKSLYIPENAVIHTIAGIHNLEPLVSKELKVLILGYKSIRRGKDFINCHGATIRKKIAELEAKIPEYLESFKVLSFDNLALEQLNIKKYVSPEDWKTHYMGDDGSFTMYIDLVKEEFAKNSTSVDRYNLNDYKSIEESLTKLKTKMSTSACITVLGTDGIYRSVYNHSDGYPDWLFNQLRTYFNSQELADWIVNHGDVSFLNQPVGLAIWDKNYDSPYKGEETDDKNASRFYCNRPGEEWNNIKAHEHASMEDVYMKYLGEYFDDYHYFWDGSKWRIVKVNHVDPLKVIYNEKEN